MEHYGQWSLGDNKVGVPGAWTTADGGRPSRHACPLGSFPGKPAKLSGTLGDGGTGRGACRY